MLKKINYNDEKFWGNIDSEVKQDKPKADSFITVHTYCGPMPVAISAHEVFCFNSLEAVAGYFKYKLIKGMAYLIMGLEVEDPEEASLEEYLTLDSEDPYIKEAQDTMKQCVEMLDIALQGKASLTAALINASHVFNALFETTDHTARFEVLFNEEMIKAFLEAHPEEDDDYPEAVEEVRAIYEQM